MKAMKKIFTALLAVAMTLALVSAGSAVEVEIEGEGTPESPLLIGTPEQLLEFGKRVTDGDTDLCAELTADITVSEWTITSTAGTKYSSIGVWGAGALADSLAPYVGVFDGKGFKLTLTKTNASGTESARIALFHTIGAGGTVKNLDLQVNFSGLMHIAGVAGTNYGTIQNVTVAGSIAATHSESYAGGVAGRNGCKVENKIVTSAGKILDCLNTAAVTGKSYVGGIAGDFLGEMRRCGNTGIITGTSSYLGGLLSMGKNVNPTLETVPVEKRFIVSDCYNAGQVVSGTQNAAALLGGNNYSEYMADWEDDNGEYPDFQVSNVFNYGGISGYSADYLSIIALLSTNLDSTDYTAENITNIFSNTYYLENSGGRLFYPTILNSNSTVNAVIISKTSTEFANAAMADLLNGERTDDDAPWEYLEDALYPTLVKGFVDPDENEEPVASFSLGGHSETLTAGTAGEASFAVTAENMPDGSYTASLADAPAGVTVAGGSVMIFDGSGTVTLSTTTETPKGGHEIKLTLTGSDVSASAFLSLTIGEKPEASFSLGGHSETLTAGTAGEASFAVTAENMPDGSYTASLTDAPMGVTVAGGSVTISGGSGTVTLSTSAETPVGSHEIKLTLTGSDVSASAFLSLTIGAGDAVEVEIEGKGTPESPLLIGTADQLLEFGKLVTDGETGLWAELTDDITVAEWTITSTAGTKYSSIGKWGAGALVDSPSPYVGVFDGKGFKLTLTKKDKTSYESARIALFHTIGTDGVVKNLDLQVDFSGLMYIAGVAGSNYGTIQNVTVAGTIAATGGSSYAGGIAGLNGCKFDSEDNILPGRILDCLNKAHVTGKSDVGGIAGSFLGEMERCGNTGTITGVTRLGGLLSMGENVNPTSETIPVEKRFIVSDCYNAGQVVSGYSLPHFAALLGGGDNAEFMADWRDEQTDEYPDFQVSGVFNYGSVIASGIPFRDSTIIATLCYSPAFGNYSAADIANIFSNTYYLKGCGGQLFVPSVLNGSDGLGTNTVKTVIKSKDIEAFASPAMATLLNNGRTGDDAPWEYVTNALYPTLKRPVVPGSTDTGNTDPGSTDPGNTDPGNTDPGSTDPGNADPGNTDPGNTDPGDTDNTGGSTNNGGGTTPVDSDTTPVTVPGGNVTVPSDTVIDESTGVATLPSGGGITIADGATALIVPPDTTIDLDTGIITVTQSGGLILADGTTELIVPPDTTIDSSTGIITVTKSGGLTLADGATELIVPPDTTIDSSTGIITVTQSGAVTVPASGVPDALGIEYIVPSGTTIDPATGIMSVAADAGTLTLPGTDGVTGSDQDIEVIVPVGTTINPATGTVTAVKGGWVVLPGSNHVLDTPMDMRRGASVGDDLEFNVTPGTTVDPYTGSVTITNGGEITLHDGTTVTVAPGTTIDPFTGVRNEPDATNEGSNNTGTAGLSDDGGSSGGCDAGAAGFALLVFAMIAASSARKKTRGKK